MAIIYMKNAACVENDTEFFIHILVYTYPHTRTHTRAHTHIHIYLIYLYSINKIVLIVDGTVVSRILTLSRQSE